MEVSCFLHPIRKRSNEVNFKNTVLLRLVFWGMMKVGWDVTHQHPHRKCSYDKNDIDKIEKKMYMLIIIDWISHIGLILSNYFKNGALFHLFDTFHVRWPLKEAWKVVKVVTAWSENYMEFLLGFYSHILRHEEVYVSILSQYDSYHINHEYMFLFESKAPVVTAPFSRRIQCKSCTLSFHPSQCVLCVPDSSRQWQLLWTIKEYHQSLYIDIYCIFSILLNSVSLL